MQTKPALAAFVDEVKDRQKLALLFLLVVVFTFASRTAVFWHQGRLLAGLHADEPFHYTAELVRLAPDHYPEDPAVQDTRSISGSYGLFYRLMGGMTRKTGWSLMTVNFVVCWTANVIYLAGVMWLLRRLGASPGLCAIGTVLASQRFALISGQTLVAHGVAIPREVWQSLLPWFVLWFAVGSRQQWRLLIFYGVLSTTFCATYPLWAVELGLAFGLVDLWRIVRDRDWRSFAWLAGAAIVSALFILAANYGQFEGLTGEQSALFDRMQPGKPIYYTKGFRRFVLFAVIGLCGFWQLGWRFIKEQEPLRRLWSLWLVAVAVCCVYQPLEQIFPKLGLFYLGRLSLVAFLISMVVATVALQYRFSMIAHWKKWALVIGIVTLCAFPLWSAYRGRLDRSFVDLCRWIRANAPVSATFFVPPIDDVHHFRIYAERGMWIAPYDKTTLWRTKRQYALMQEHVDTLKNFFAATASVAEREAVLERLREESVEFVITPASASWSSLSWPVVHEQAGWQLHAPPGSLHAQRSP
jgi:hypothetical protein